MWSIRVEYSFSKSMGTEEERKSLIDFRILVGPEHCRMQSTTNFTHKKDPAASLVSLFSNCSYSGGSHGRLLHKRLLRTYKARSSLFSGWVSRSKQLAECT